jgi:hypothetical protein
MVSITECASVATTRVFLKVRPQSVLAHRHNPVEQEANENTIRLLTVNLKNGPKHENVRPISSSRKPKMSFLLLQGNFKHHTMVIPAGAPESIQYNTLQPSGTLFGLV